MYVDLLKSNPELPRKHLQVYSTRQRAAANLNNPQTENQTVEYEIAKVISLQQHKRQDWDSRQSPRKEVSKNHRSTIPTRVLSRLHQRQNRQARDHSMSRKGG